MAAVIASVEPHVIVTPSSASALMPLKLRTFAATASLSSWDPMVISYGLWSPLMAAAAACLTERGAGKSGDPWARFTAPTFSARMDMSLIAESAKSPSLREPNLRVELVFKRPHRTYRGVFNLKSFNLLIDKPHTGRGEGELLSRVRDRRGDAEVPGGSCEERGRPRSLSLCPFAVALLAGRGHLSRRHGLDHRPARGGGRPRIGALRSGKRNRHSNQLQDAEGRALRRSGARAALGRRLGREGAALHSDQERIPQLGRRAKEGLLEVHPGGVHPAREG